MDQLLSCGHTLKNPPLSVCLFPTALDFFSEAFRSLGQTEIWVQLGAPGSCSKPSQCLCSVVRTCGLPSSWQMCILSACFLRQDLTGNPWVASHSRTFDLSLPSARILGVCCRTQEKKTIFYHSTPENPVHRPPVKNNEFLGVLSQLVSSSMVMPSPHCIWLVFQKVLPLVIYNAITLFQSCTHRS